MGLSVGRLVAQEPASSGNGSAELRRLDLFSFGLLLHHTFVWWTAFTMHGSRFTLHALTNLTLGRSMLYIHSLVTYFILC
jgi:hypothetical protein